MCSSPPSMMEKVECQVSQSYIARRENASASLRGGVDLPFPPLHTVLMNRTEKKDTDNR